MGDIEMFVRDRLRDEIKMNNGQTISFARIDENIPIGETFEFNKHDIKDGEFILMC